MELACLTAGLYNLGQHSVVNSLVSIAQKMTTSGTESIHFWSPVDVEGFTENIGWCTSGGA